MRHLLPHAWFFQLPSLNQKVFMGKSKKEFRQYINHCYYAVGTVGSRDLKSAYVSNIK